MTTQPPEGELLPCPFCGGAGSVSEFPINDDGDTRWAVACDCSNTPEDQPEVERYAQAFGNNRDEAIAAWNRRTPTSKPPVQDKALLRERYCQRADDEGCICAEINGAPNSTCANWKVRPAETEALLREVVEALKALRSAVLAHGTMNGREFVTLGIQVGGAISRAEAHLKESEG